MIRRVLWVSALLLPTLAVGLVGYFWFGGPASPTYAAKLWVFASDRGLVSVRAFVGSVALNQPPPPTDVVLVATDSGGQQRRFSTVTSIDGTADFSLHWDAPPLTLTLLRPLPGQAAESLVSGVYEPLDSLAWITASSLPAIRPKAPFADLSIEVSTGVLAVPFVSHVSVRGTNTGCFARFLGAFVPEPESCCDSGCSVYPTEHIVEAELGHSSGDKLASVLLPLVPGAMPVRLDQERVYVLSATPRSMAHLAWVTEHEVLGFSSVLLSPDALPVLPGPAIVRAGTPVSWGAVATPSMFAGSSERSCVWVVTSSEPDFASAATVAWPLHAACNARAVQFRPRPVPPALDGFAQEFARAENKAHSRRRDLALLLCGVLVAQVVSLWVYVNQTRAELLAVPIQKSRLWWAVIVCLVLGFGGMIALFWSK